MENDNNKMSNFLDDPRGIFEPQPYQITERVNSRTYDIYLSQEVESANKYTKLFDILRNSTRYDIIKIHINCFGGELRTGIQLINAMKQSEANIVTILDSFAFSLAPLILFAGDNIQIGEHTLLMFHDYSSGNYGKGSEQYENAIAMNEYYKGLLEKYAKPFLTDEEITKITDGKDLYFNSEQTKNRIELIQEDMRIEDAKLCQEEAELDKLINDTIEAYHEGNTEEKTPKKVAKKRIKKTV